MAKERLEQAQRRLLLEALERSQRDTLITPYERIVLRTATSCFCVHPPVLTAGSTYFKNIFDGPKYFSKDLVLEDIDSKTLDIILDFLYTGSLETLNEDDSNCVFQLLCATKYLGIDLLYRHCCEVLTKKCGAENLSALWEWGEENHYDEIKDEIVKYVAQNFGMVAKFSDLLNSFNVSKMNALLDHADLCTTTDCVLSSVLANDLAVSALEKMRFLRDTFLNGDIEDITNVTLANMVEWANDNEENCLLQHLQPDCAERLTNSNEPPALPGQNLICFRKVKHPLLKFKENFMSMYNIQDTSWSQPKKMPFAIDNGMTVVRCKARIYFIGGAGCDETFLTKVVYEYSPSLNAITSIGALEQAVFLAGAGVLDSEIYILGGWRCDDEGEIVPTCDVQKYDPCLRLTSKVAQTLIHPNTPFVTSINQCLFVVDMYFSTVQQYNSSIDTWTEVRLTFGGTAWGATALGQKLYILQQKSPHHLQVYDVEKCSWTTLLAAHAPLLMPGMWTLPPLKEYKPPLLLLRDENYCLHSFNPENGEWDAMNKSYCIADDVFCEGLYDTLWIKHSD